MRAARRESASEPVALGEETKLGLSLSPVAIYLAIFLVFSVLFLCTAQRGVSWQDSGLFQSRVIAGDSAGNNGLALAHPLYILLGHGLAKISRAQLPFLLNGFSGVAMAFALANLSLLISLLSRRRLVSLLIPACLGVCHCVWWLSTIAEVYTLYVGFFAAELYFAVRFAQEKNPKHLILTALLNGLSFGVHNFALLVLPIYAFVFLPELIRGGRGIRSVVAAMLAWFVGGMPLWILVIEAYLESGSLRETASSLLFGVHHMEQVTNLVSLNANFVVNMALTGLSLFNPILVFAAIGVWTMRTHADRRLSWLLLGLLAVEGIFYVRYSVPDQFTFLLPTMMVLSILAAVGMDAVLDRLPKFRRSVVFGVAGFVLLIGPFYWVLPGVAQSVHPSLAQARQPNRDEARYWLVPWKHDEASAAIFGDSCLGDGTRIFELEVPPGSQMSALRAWEYAKGPVDPAKQDPSNSSARVTGKHRVQSSIPCPLPTLLAR